MLAQCNLGIGHQSAALPFDSAFRQPRPLTEVPGSVLRVDFVELLVPGRTAALVQRRSSGHPHHRAAPFLVAESLADQQRSKYIVPYEGIRAARHSGFKTREARLGHKVLDPSKGA